jgi:hypothetical protein
VGSAVKNIDIARLPRRGLCLVVTGREARSAQGQPPRIDAPCATGEFPDRPAPRLLSESIPLFFVGRNKSRLWVVREAEGRSGGIFLFKRSALRFAAKKGLPIGCATMLLRERFELDVENHGNPLVAWLDAALRRLARLIPEYPPPMPIRRDIFRGEHR